MIDNGLCIQAADVNDGWVIGCRYDVLSVQELSQVPTNPGSCSIDGDTGLAACALLDALNTAANRRGCREVLAHNRACAFLSNLVPR